VYINRDDLAAPADLSLSLRYKLSDGITDRISIWDTAEPLTLGYLAEDTDYKMTFSINPPDSEQNVACTDAIHFTTSCTGEMFGVSSIQYHEAAPCGQGLGRVGFA